MATLESIIKAIKRHMCIKIKPKTKEELNYDSSQTSTRSRNHSSRH